MSSHAANKLSETKTRAVLPPFAVTLLGTLLPLGINPTKKERKGSSSLS